MHRFGPAIMLVVALVGVVAAGGVLTATGVEPSFGPAPGAVDGQSVAEATPRTAQLHVTATAEPTAGAADRRIRIIARLHNPADRDRRERIALRLDEDGTGEFATVVSTRTVSVPAGETRQVEFAVKRDRFAPGSYAFGIGPAERQTVLASDVVTLEPAAFSVRDLGRTTAVRGERVSIEVGVANVGDYDGGGTLTLAIDADRDGQFEVDERLQSRSITLAAAAQGTLTFAVESASLEPGTYPIRVSSAGSAREGTLVVQQPPTFHVVDVNAGSDVVAGEPVTLSVTVRNVGEVTGEGTVTVAGPGQSGSMNATVSAAAGESRTLDIALDTSGLARGNYTYRVSTERTSVERTVRVRAAQFDVRELRSDGDQPLGEDLQFTAVVANTGDAADRQSVELRIDLDGDGHPESYGFTERVDLAPGERTAVTFTVPGDGRDGTIRMGELLGRHVYGVYTADTSRTDVVEVELPDIPVPAATAPSDDQVTLDEISQAKYGYRFEELSEETQQQLVELHQRQPFADGLTAREVLTREEIAREHFGVDIEPGEPFDLSALEAELQQQIESRYDAQFESDG